MSVVKFVENVPGRVPPGHYREMAWELRQRPGVWALVSEDDSGSSLTTRINNGVISWFQPIGEWEATSRTTDSGLRECYARYVGGLFDE